MTAKSKVSDTAFLTAWERTWDVEVSQDPYAKLWVSNAARTLGEDFVKKGVSSDAIALCLRNRYFLDALRAFEKQHGDFTFFNIAAGFTMYPFILNHHPCIEIDQPHVVDYKKKKLQQFEKEGAIPKREIQFIPLDLNRISDHKKISDLILQSQRTGPCFVLLEGILYYLEKKAVESLLAILEKSLLTKSQVGIVCVSQDFINSKAIQSTLEYFEKNLGIPKQSYTWLEREFFEKRKSLRILEQTNYAELERKYCKEIKGLGPDNVLFETLYLLEKKAPDN